MKAKKGSISVRRIIKNLEVGENNNEKSIQLYRKQNLHSAFIEER